MRFMRMLPNPGPDLHFQQGQCCRCHRGLSQTSSRGTLAFEAGGAFYMEGRSARHNGRGRTDDSRSTTKHPSELQQSFAHVDQPAQCAASNGSRGARWADAFAAKERAGRRRNADAIRGARGTAFTAGVQGRLDETTILTMTGKSHDFRVDYQADSTASGSTGGRHRARLALRLLGRICRAHQRSRPVPRGLMAYDLGRSVSSPTGMKTKTVFRTGRSRY